MLLRLNSVILSVCTGCNVLIHLSLVAHDHYTYLSKVLYERIKNQ